jgi:hypothetical protein
VFLKGIVLLCACGETMTVTKQDERLSQSIIYDLLLDRHARHKEKKRRKS